MCSEHRIAALKLPYGVVFTRSFCKVWASKVEMRLARPSMRARRVALARRFVAACRRDGRPGLALRHTRFLTAVPIGFASTVSKPVACWRSQSSHSSSDSALGELYRPRRLSRGACTCRVKSSHLRCAALARDLGSHASPLQHRLTAGQTCAERNSVIRLGGGDGASARNAHVLPPRRRGARRRDRPLRDGRGPLRDRCARSSPDVGRARGPRVCPRAAQICDKQRTGEPDARRRRLGRAQDHVAAADGVRAVGRGDGVCG